MDENNNVNENSGIDKKAQEKQHTEQNTKKALQVAEKGAATYFAGPEGAAAVNALHNAPVVGKALNKVEDKAVEKLGKNKNIANLANKLGDSGATDAANKGLDAVGASGGGGAGGAAAGASGAAKAGGATAGASASATSAAKGINEGLGKVPGGLGGSGGSDGPGGGTGSGGGDDDRSPSERTVETVKKAAKIIKMLSPILPYIGIFFAIVLIVIIVMSQIMMIKDKILGIIVDVAETGQKFQNFVTGNGWYTEDESFFKNLKFANSDFKTSTGENLDIPLIAATIHYSKMTDINNWDGEDNEHFENNDIGADANNYSDSQDSSLSSSIIETYQTWSFYQVANAKLGNWDTFIPGGRGLLGHLVSSKFTIKKVCIEDALKAWEKFATDLFNIPDFSVYKDAYNVDSEAVSSFISALIFGEGGSLQSMLNPYNLVDTINNIVAFNAEGQSYTEWWQANIVYEIKELGEYLTGNYNDDRLKEALYSYYNNLPESTTPQNLVEEISNFWNQFLAALGGVHYDEDNDCITVPVPSIERSVDYRSYYRYLVNVYIPLTYFRNKKVDVDYSFLEVVNIANSIFDQKYLYDYLIDDGTDGSASGCDYNFSGSSSQTVSVDKNMIDNLYVNVMSPSCGTIKNCDTIEETVSLKDYIIGVVYREIGASINDNAEYLKANMIAAKSFTVGRRTATQIGDKYYINMINSTNDQVYCSVTKGCMEASSNQKPAPTPELLERLGKIYDEVYTDFLYNSSSGSFTGYYRAKESQCIGANLAGACLGQTDSEAMGEAGKDYEAILGNFYVDPIGIVDISSGNFSVGVKQCISTGLELGTDGFYMRTTAPESTNIYFNAPYVSDSNRGQCVWYVKGRAQEIIANSIADASKKETAKNAITATYGNGNQWFTAELQKVFGSSTDYKLPKVGAIAVYTWTNSRCADYWGGTCKENYGHSLIVESVSGDTVTISQGYTHCSTGSPSWDCPIFDYSSHPISYMKDLGGNYEFIGYIYLLD